MTSEVTYKVWLQGSDGKNYLVTYEGLKTDLGITKLQEQHEQLRARVRELEKPFRKQKILDFLKHWVKPTTIRTVMRYVPTFEFSDFNELLAEGKITQEQHGKLTVYKIGEVKVQ